MNTIRRMIVAALLAGLPLLSLAQGFKCKQPDGSTSYQDHACASGSASTAVQTDLSGVDLGLSAVEGLDPSCRANVQHTVSVCAPQVDNSVRRCYHSSLNAHCYLNMTAGTGVRREQACVQQAMPCISNGLSEAKRCVHQELQPACVEQVAAARRR
jgi:hypothetical protein